MNRYEEQGQLEHSIEIQPPAKRVGGWLLAFCILTFAGVPKSIQAIAATKSPLLLALYITLVILSVAAGFTVGIRAASALTWVGFAVASRFLYGLFQAYLGTRMSTAALPNAMSPAATEYSLAAGNLLFAITWGLYFHVSTRVRETLGRNL